MPVLARACPSHGPACHCSSHSAPPASASSRLAFTSHSLSAIVATRCPSRLEAGGMARWDARRRRGRATCQKPPGQASESWHDHHDDGS
eukprot:3372141-Rhodomonas_salina.1